MLLDELPMMPMPPAIVNCLAFSEDSQKIIARIFLKEYVWDLDSGKLESSPSNPVDYEDRIYQLHAGAFSYSAVFVSDMRIATCGGSMAMATIFDCVSKKQLFTIPVKNRISAAAFQPNAPILVTVAILDPREYVHPVPEITLQELPQPIKDCAAPAPATALVEFWDISRLFWDKHTGKAYPQKIRTCYFHRLEGEKNTWPRWRRVTYMAVSPDGTRLFLGIDNPPEVTRDGKEYVRVGYVVSVPGEKEKSKTPTQQENKKKPE